MTSDTKKTLKQLINKYQEALKEHEKYINDYKLAIKHCEMDIPILKNKINDLKQLIEKEN